MPLLMTGVVDEDVETPFEELLLSLVGEGDFSPLVFGDVREFPRLPVGERLTTDLGLLLS